MRLSCGILPDFISYCIFLWLSLCHRVLASLFSEVKPAHLPGLCWLHSMPVVCALCKASVSARVPGKPFLVTVSGGSTLPPFPFSAPYLVLVPLEGLCNRQGCHSVHSESSAPSTGLTCKHCGWMSGRANRLAEALLSAFQGRVNMDLGMA